MAADAADLEARAAAVAVRGSLLFHLFLAETLAGDTAHRAALEAVEGWAIDVGADGYEVAAVGGGEVLRRVSFAANGSPLVEAGRGDRATPRQAALAAAREAGADAAARLGGRFAAVAVPPPLSIGMPREIEVYLVRLPDRPQDVAAGPHRRLLFDVARGHASEPETLCAADRVVPDAAGRGAVTLAYPAAPVPSELHVMLSLQHGVALEVDCAPAGARWRVEGERVTRL